MGVDVVPILVTAAISGGISAIATVAALKVDLRWVKRTLGRLETRVQRLEGAVFQRR